MISVFEDESDPFQNCAFELLDFKLLNQHCVKDVFIQIRLFHNLGSFINPLLVSFSEVYCMNPI
jgi:hypothetical protein